MKYDFTVAIILMFMYGSPEQTKKRFDLLNFKTNYNIIVIETYHLQMKT